MRRTALFTACLGMMGSAACAATGPSPPGPTFMGTIFVNRWSTAGQPVEQPVGIDGRNREFQVPLDLSPYYPADPPGNYPMLVHDFDVSHDGRYLYVAAYTVILRFDLPGGGGFRELGGPGNVATLRVSPNGHRIAFQRAVEGDTWVMNADGTDPRRVLPPIGGTEELGAPVWVGSDRLLVPIVKETYPALKSVVMDIRAPDWTTTEYLPLHNRIRGTCCGRGPLLATPDGSTLFVASYNIADELILTEFPLGSPQGIQRVRYPANAGGQFVISPDGQAVAAFGTSYDIVLYDLTSGAQLGRIAGKPGRTEAPMAWTTAEYPEAAGGP